MPRDRQDSEFPLNTNFRKLLPQSVLRTQRKGERMGDFFHFSLCVLCALCGKILAGIAGNRYFSHAGKAPTIAAEKAFRAFLDMFRSRMHDLDAIFDMLSGVVSEKPL